MQNFKEHQRRPRLESLEPRLLLAAFAEIEPNNNIVQAQPLKGEFPYEVTASFSPRGESDFFSFRPPLHSRVKVSIADDSSTFARFRVITPGLNQTLVGGASFDPVEFDVTLTGEYRIEVDCVTLSTFCRSDAPYKLIIEPKINETDHVWLVHGFRPFIFTEEEFRAPYCIENLPGCSANGQYSNDVDAAFAAVGKSADNHALFWESSQGWQQALGAVVLDGALAFAPRNPVVSLLRRVTDLIVAAGLKEGRMHSLAASRELVTQVTRLIENSNNPTEETITFIGHSRGGAVAARAMNELRPVLDLQGVQSQLIVLDAYGTDWPGVSRILGADAPTGLSTDHNFRVEDGLIEALVQFDSLSTLVRTLISGLALTTVPSLEFEFNVTEPWKAPERKSFGTNSVISGTNHIDITDAFFNMPVQELASILTAASATLVAEGEAATTGTDVTEIIPIQGGNADQILAMHEEFVAESGSTNDLPEYIKTLASVFQQPETFLRIFWQSESVILNAESRTFEFAADGALTQLVMVPPTGTFLRIADVTFQDGSELDIYFGESLLGNISSNSDIVEIEIPGTNESQIDHLRIVSPTGGVTFATAAFSQDPPNLDARVVAVSGRPHLELSGDFANQSLFYESNGIKGLQVGAGGDTQVAFDLNAEKPRISTESFTEEPLALIAASGAASEPEFFAEIPIHNDFHTNLVRPQDTNFDGAVTARDALIIINYLGGDDDSPNPAGSRFVLDVNMDRSVSALDALIVINFLGRTSTEVSAEFSAIDEANDSRDETHVNKFMPFGDTQLLF